MLTDSTCRKHLEALRQKLSDQRSQVAHRLATLDIQPWLLPRAVVYLWYRLPAGIDAATLAREALRHHVVLAPGNAFSLSHDFSDFMRDNVTQTHHEAVYQALESVMTLAPLNGAAP